MSWKRYLHRVKAIAVGIALLAGSSTQALAATLFSTEVMDGDNWQGSMLADGSGIGQEITLSAPSDITSLEWTGRYCFLSGAGCLKIGLEGYTDNFHVTIEGVTSFNTTVSRTGDLNWSSDSAVIGYTLFTPDLMLDAGSYIISVWNEVNDPEIAWYWNFGGDSGGDLAITVEGETIAPVPLPFTSLLLLSGLSALWVPGRRHKAAACP